MPAREPQRERRPVLFDVTGDNGNTLKGVERYEDHIWVVV
jgi:hypothetical protein